MTYKTTDKGMRYPIQIIHSIIIHSTHYRVAAAKHLERVAEQTHQWTRLWNMGSTATSRGRIKNNLKSKSTQTAKSSSALSMCYSTIIWRWETVEMIESRAHVFFVKKKKENLIVNAKLFTVDVWLIALFKSFHLFLAAFCCAFSSQQ